MSTSRRPAPSMTVPHGWFWNPLGEPPEDAKASIEKQVDDRIKSTSRLSASRSILVDLIDSWQRFAVDVDADAAAICWDDESEFGLASAQMLVTRYNHEERNDLQADKEELRSHLSEPGDLDEGEPIVEDFDTPWGVGLRSIVMRRAEVAEIANGEARSLITCVEYWVFATDVEEVVHFRFMTANLLLLSEMTADFDSIVSSMEWPAH